ncbi:MAG TPA: PhzF family phenazine biosynthesis protein [Xanthomonadaceae bacterium]|nr:PhzF family phenazine biosynthesis protein [Xanthomonadaceae bacterium]
MRCVAFKQVDVFSPANFGGNPVAVILDGEALEARDMQTIARWTNLSETTFVLPPTTAEASYRVRIFTPRRELPFAGHPSLGTAHAAMEAGVASAREGRLVQECGAGLLPLRVESGDGFRRLFVQAPEPKLHAPDAAMAGALSAALGAVVADTPAPRAIDVGPVWIVARLESGPAVRALAPDFAAVAALCVRATAVGVTVYGPEEAGDVRFVVRSFAPGEAIPEDPVCGSGNAAVAAFLRQAGALPAPRWVVSQGREVDREGRVWVCADDASIEIGGRTVTRIDGVIRLD